MAEEIITESMRESLKESFKALAGDVNMHVFTKKGSNDQYNDLTVQVIREIAETHPKIKAHFHELGDEDSKKYDVRRSPTLLISPEKYNIRFTGSPLGEEGRSLVMAIIMASTGQTIASEDSRKRLDRLKEKRHVRVFVSPTCPYCPQQFLYAASAAIEKPDLISAEAVEIFENRDLAEKFGAMSVPKTFVNDVLTSPGLEPEEYFMESVVEGKRVEHVMPTGAEDVREYDVVILGGGPAGLTSAIYAERSGLRSIIFERSNVGGQVAITPVVENYPGFARIQGKALVDMMAQQATQYAPVVQGIGVDNIKKADDGFEVSTSRGPYKARAIVIATGAAYRTLDVPGEKEFAGRGVSYCATCDGYIFKDGKAVVVVGGGNTALTDALYLESLGARVSVVHRRDSFRAEDRLQQSLFQRNIEVHRNSRITEIIGTNVVERVKIENVKTGETKELKVDGVFIAIGYKPNNDIAAMLGLELDPDGYIRVDRTQRTSMPFVYAAGDITGSEKQIAVAAGQGSIAAISAFEDLSNPYWKRSGILPT
jgi:thioredoxin reductase (NADPH)